LRPAGWTTGRPHALAWLLYTLLALIVMREVLPDPGALTFSSYSSDNFANFWNLWWVRHALSTGSSLFETSLLYYPVGTSLAFTEFGPVYGVLSVPLLAAGAGTVLVHNLWVGLTFVLTGYLVFVLCRRETGTTGGPLVAGALVLGAAYRFHHLEHLNLLSGYAIPLTLWVAAVWLLRGPEEARPPRRAWLLALAGCGLLLAGTSETYLALTAVLLVVLGLGTLAWQRGRLRPGWPWRAGAGAAAILMGTVPVVYPWYREWLGGRTLEFTAAETARWSPDVVGFLVPARSWLLGPAVAHLNQGLHEAGGNAAFLGFALLGLAVAGTRGRGRAALPWWLAAVVTWLLCLGPVLWVAGREVNLPITPYTAATALFPPLASGRVPTRFLMATLIALAPPAAWGFDAVLSRRGRLAAGLVAAWAVIELLPAPRGTERTDVHEVYRRLARDPRPGSVLEIRPHRGLEAANRDMYNQTVHHRPVVGGGLIRPSTESVAVERQLDLSRRLSDVEEIPKVLDDLSRLGVGFVIWHRDGLSEQIWSGTLYWFSRSADGVYQDTTLAVFRLRDGGETP